MRNIEKVYINMKKFINTKNIIIVVLLALLVIGGYFYNSKTGNLNDELEMEVKLNEVLKDSVQFFETKNGDLVAEKRTLQGDVNELLKENTGLNENQKDLLNTVKKLNKEWKKDREIFAAARIEYESLIDSLNSFIAGATGVDTLKNTVSFVQNDIDKDFIYNIDILGVRPVPITFNPEIKFNMIDFPNEQTISFNWDNNERKDYPVSFTVQNTNEYYKVNNIESYTIPEINKSEIDPNFWQKSWRWIKVNGKYILVGATGFTIGAAISN